MNSDSAEILADRFAVYFKRLHDDCQPLALTLKFNKRHALHQTAVSLYGTILELSGSCLRLVDAKVLTGVPVLLRALLEAYVDLYNLCTEPAYGYSLELSYNQEWLNLFVAAKDGTNEYLHDLTPNGDVQREISATQERVAELKNKGGVRLTNWDKFKRAGMQAEYQSIYNHLCCESHNNLRALLARHVEQDGADFNLVIYRAFSASEALNYLSIGSELLLRASFALHQLLNSSVLPKLQQHRVQLDSLRDAA